jgi:hypothetical protein
MYNVLIFYQKKLGPGFEYLGFGLGSAVVGKSLANFENLRLRFEYKNFLNINWYLKMIF